MTRSLCRPARNAVAVVFTSLLLAAGPLSAGPARAAGEIQVRRDLAYGDHAQQAMDVYLPASDDASGAGVVIVHGGGWKIGDKEDYTDEALAMAEAGLAVFNTNYRLENDTDRAWPDELTDVQDAVRFVAERAPVFGVDAERLGLLGGSAGGQLAAMVGMLGTDGDPVAEPGSAIPAGTRVGAVVSWSGIFDLTTLAPRNGAEAEDCGGNPRCLTVLDPEIISGFLGCSLEECPDTYSAASPIDHLGPETAPMFILNSLDEVVPLAQPDAMLDRLAEAGVETERLFFDGNRHSRAYANDALEPSILYLRRALDVDPASETTGTAAPIVAAAVVILGLVAVAVNQRRQDERIASSRGEPEERAS